jgi:hypothetical protein
MAISVEQQIKALKKKLNKLAKDLPANEIPVNLAEDGKQVIQSRTRNGFGLSSDNSRFKKLRIKKSTVKRRKSHDKAGELSNKTTPGTANLTLSGSLIDNLKIKKVSSKISRIVPSNKIDRVQSKSRRKNPRTDKQKANRLEEQGFKFIGFTKRELRKLVDDNVTTYVVKVLNSLFN